MEAMPPPPAGRGQSRLSATRSRCDRSIYWRTHGAADLDAVGAGTRDEDKYTIMVPQRGVLAYPVHLDCRSGSGSETWGAHNSLLWGFLWARHQRKERAASRSGAVGNKEGKESDLIFVSRGWDGRGPNPSSIALVGLVHKRLPASVGLPRCLLRPRASSVSV